MTIDKCYELPGGDPDPNAKTITTEAYIAWLLDECRKRGFDPTAKTETFNPSPADIAAPNELTPMQQAEEQLASETPDQTQAHIEAILAKPEEFITDDDRRYMGITIGWDYDKQESADDIDELVTYEKGSPNDLWVNDESAPHIETVTTSPAVFAAMKQALQIIADFAPTDKPEVPDYSVIPTEVERLAAASAYSIALTAWSLAQQARPALAFAQLAAEEAAPDEESTQPLPPPQIPSALDFVEREARLLLAGDLIALEGSHFVVKSLEYSGKTGLTVTLQLFNTVHMETLPMHQRALVLTWRDPKTPIPDWYRRLHPTE